MACLAPAGVHSRFRAGHIFAKKNLTDAQTMILYGHEQEFKCGGTGEVGSWSAEALFQVGIENQNRAAEAIG
jgi:hypothetical protein